MIIIPDCSALGSCHDSPAYFDGSARNIANSTVFMTDHHHGTTLAYPFRNGRIEERTAIGIKSGVWFVEENHIAPT